MHNFTSTHEIEKELDCHYKIKGVSDHNRFYGIDNETENCVFLTLINKPNNYNSEATKILQDLQVCSKLNHENIVRLLNLKAIPNPNQDKTLVIISERLESDLYQIIHSRQELTLDHRRFFIYQILRALKYLHSANIILKKLKPSDILINSICDIKIRPLFLENYIDFDTFRWYKAPEIFLQQESTFVSSDIWSVGCILVELINRRPLFQGSSTINMLTKIVDTIGSPDEDDLFYVTSHRTIEFMNSLDRVDKVDWRLLAPSATSDEIELIKMMLQWNPSKRISVDEALKYSYFDGLHDPSDEPCTSPIEVEGSIDGDRCFWKEIEKIRDDNNYK